MLCYLLIFILTSSSRTLISALHVWLDSYPEDFRDPPNHPCLAQLVDFCEEYLPATELEAKVRHRLERYSREPKGDPLLTPPSSLALRAPITEWASYRLPNVRVRDFAEQLTRMDVVSDALFVEDLYDCIIFFDS